MTLLTAQLGNVDVDVTSRSHLSENGGFCSLVAITAISAGEEMDAIASSPQKEPAKELHMTVTLMLP